MARFFEISDGTSINIDQIVSASEDQSGVFTKMALRMSNGDKHVIILDDWNSIKEMTQL